jgi:NAD(P)-dependent dehydrogenase (short-subunit alcohol dehydrogenase family)
VRVLSRYLAFHADDPHFANRDYEKWQAYGQAKTANALFALHLDKLASQYGIRAFSVHPGGIQTNLGRYLTEDDIAIMRARAAGEVVGGAPAIIWKSPQAGAATTVWAATSPHLAGQGGVYCEDCDIAQLLVPGEVLATGVMAHACDPDAAAALWAMSEAMTGVTFQP